MIAIDIPTVLLVVGIVALCVTTAISSLALPTFTITLRRRRRKRRTQTSPSHELPPFTPRRVITGRPAELRPIELPAPRQAGSAPDDPSSAADIRYAEELIEHLLEHHPQRLVDLLTRWIHGDVQLEDPYDDEIRIRPAVQHHRL
jgi:hypothetical protein